MSYVHFSRDERVELRGLLRTKLYQADIARLLGRSPGALSREIAKGGGRKAYCVKKAQQKTRASHLAANQRFRKMGNNRDLTDRVLSLLELEWSPEQIVGRTSFEVKFGLVDSGTTITSAQTIYNFVNADKMLHHLLPRGHSKYRRTGENKERKAKRAAIDPRRAIETRPEAVEARQELGHWEGDTIIGKEKKERILTHVERTTGYLLASKTASGEALEIRKYTERDFKVIPKRQKKTCTYDRGVEFADWETTEKNTKITTYFANPYHSWERGTNENTNGLLRRSFPKGTSFATLSEKQLSQAVYRINHRPRKRLGYKTPHEVLKGVAVRSLI